MGHKGWIGIRLDDGPGGAPDWDGIAARVRVSFRMTAPKRIAAAVPD